MTELLINLNVGGMEFPVYAAYQQTFLRFSPQRQNTELARIFKAALNPDKDPNDTWVTNQDVEFLFVDRNPRLFYYALNYLAYVETQNDDEDEAAGYFTNCIMGLNYILVQRARELRAETGTDFHARLCEEFFELGFFCGITDLTALEPELHEWVNRAPPDFSGISNLTYHQKLPSIRGPKFPEPVESKTISNLVKYNDFDFSRVPIKKHFDFEEYCKVVFNLRNLMNQNILLIELTYSTKECNYVLTEPFEVTELSWKWPSDKSSKRRNSSSSPGPKRKNSSTENTKKRRESPRGLPDPQMNNRQREWSEDLSDIFFSFLHAARGLEGLHNNNILHLDFQPNKILLTQYQREKIAYFGPPAFFTNKGLTAPEITAIDEKKVSLKDAEAANVLSPKCDIFAWGASLAYVLWPAYRKKYLMSRVTLSQYLKDHDKRSKGPTPFKYVLEHPSSKKAEDSLYLNSEQAKLIDLIDKCMAPVESRCESFANIITQLQDLIIHFVVDQKEAISFAKQYLNPPTKRIDNKQFVTSLIQHLIPSDCTDDKLLLKFRWALYNFIPPLGGPEHQKTGKNFTFSHLGRLLSAFGPLDADFPKRLVSVWKHGNFVGMESDDWCSERLQDRTYFIRFGLVKWGLGACFVPVGMQDSVLTKRHRIFWDPQGQFYYMQKFDSQLNVVNEKLEGLSLSKLDFHQLWDVMNPCDCKVLSEPTDYSAYLYTSSYYSREGIDKN